MRLRTSRAAPARRRLAAPVVVTAVVTVVLAVAFAAVGCGVDHPPSGVVSSFVGTWLRVDGGQPNRDFTLVIAPEGDGATLTFTNHTNGLTATVLASVRGDVLVGTMPTADGDGIVPLSGPVPTTRVPPNGKSPAASAAATAASSASPSPSSGVPAAVDIELSHDEATGQLVVDLVQRDGTTQPVWIYERPATPGP